MLTLAMNDAASASFADLPDLMAAALSDRANTLAAQLEAMIQQKLGGGVLRERTGALARSITTTIEESGDGVTVCIATSSDVKYAAIQEFGGTIPPHEIVPNKAGALAFLVGGKQAFAAHVNIPAITLPERSYMRSSLAEMADEIWQELTEAVVETVQ